MIDDFVCLCCGNVIHGADDCYAMCSTQDVNDVKGDICEKCFETHSGEELLEITGLVACDSFGEQTN